MNFYSESLNVNSFVKNVFSFVDCLINADGICLNVCFQNKIINFSQFDSIFSNNEIEDFLLICKTDFELNISKIKKYVQQKIKFERSKNLSKDFKNKFILDDDYIFSRLIPSTSNRLFEDYIEEMREYLTDQEIEIILQHAVYDVTFKELGKKFNLKTSSVASKYIRAISKFKKHKKGNN